MNRLALAHLFFAIIFVHCHEDHHVKLEKNGAADVSYVYQFGGKDTTSGQSLDTAGMSVYIDTLVFLTDSFYRSPLISNFQRNITATGFELKYRISDINYLGEFLTPSKGTPLTFKRTRHSLTIDAGTGNADPEDDIGGYTNLITFKLTIEFPRKIRSVDNSSGLPFTFSANKFTMESNVGAVNYSGKRNLVVVKY